MKDESLTSLLKTYFKGNERLKEVLHSRYQRELNQFLGFYNVLMQNSIKLLRAEVFALHNQNLKNSIIKDDQRGIILFIRSIE